MPQHNYAFIGCVTVSGIACNHAGAAAGAITGIATTPLDVVKTRLMTQGSNRTYAGLADAFTRIWREEGAQAFLSVSGVHGMSAARSFVSAMRLRSLYVGRSMYWSHTEVAGCAGLATPRRLDRHRWLCLLHRCGAARREVSLM